MKVEVLRCFPQIIHLKLNCHNLVTGLPNMEKTSLKKFHTATLKHLAFQSKMLQKQVVNELI